MPEIDLGSVIGPIGPKGDKGEQGIQGVQGEQGIQGIQGIQGVGIKEIVFKSQASDGGNIYTITLTNDNSYDFTAPIGPQGIQGPKGEKGETVVASLKWNDILEKPTTFPSTWSEVSGTPSAFPTTWTTVTNKPTTFPTNWTNVADKPTVFASNWANVADKPSTFPTTWATVANKPTTFPPSAGTITGNLTVTGVFVCNGDVTAFSDIRLKKDIKLIDNPLEKLQMISGYTFEFKDQPGIRKAGVIAQELKSVLPEAVKETDRIFNGEKMFAVNENQIIALLIESIKELKKEVDKLKGGK